MKKWQRDGLIGWVVMLVVSFGLRSGFPLILTLLVSTTGIPGGILLGRNREGSLYPAVGGCLSGIVLFVIGVALTWILGGLTGADF